MFRVFRPFKPSERTTVYPVSKRSQQSTVLQRQVPWRIVGDQVLRWLDLCVGRRDELGGHSALEVGVFIQRAKLQSDIRVSRLVG